MKLSLQHSRPFPGQSSELSQVPAPRPPRSTAYHMAGFFPAMAWPIPYLILPCYCSHC